MKKQILSIFLAVLMVITVIPQSLIFSSAAIIKSGYCGDNVTYELYDNGELIIKGSGDMYDYDHNYQFSASPFCKDTNIKKVTINKGVTSIGRLSFDGCSGLTSVSIPSTVTSISSYAFFSCEGLTSVNIPSSVTSINARTFAGCSILPSIIIPDSVTSIGWDAFFGCRGLTSVYIPSTVTSIEKGAFFFCMNLISVYIPDSVTTIAKRAFSDCSSLKNVYYSGSETQWNNINIDPSENDELFNANFHFNTSRICGDADFDKSVTAADARLILRASVGLTAKTPELIGIADMDKDSNLTAADARLILRKSVGLTEEKTEELLTPTNAEINKAGTDLYNILYYSNDCNTAVDFDCSNMTYKELLENLFMHPSGLSFLYYDYFGKTDLYCNPYAEDRLPYYTVSEFENLNRVPQADPLNKLFDRNDYYSDINTGFYYKYSKDKIDWIFKNILNLSDAEINNPENNNYEKTYSDGFYNYYTGSYMYNGYLYSRMTTGFGGNILSSEPVLIDYNRLNDGKYEFRFKEVLSEDSKDILDQNESPEDYEFYLTAVMGLKEIDGGRYWSVYSVKTDKN